MAQKSGANMGITHIVSIPTLVEAEDNPGADAVRPGAGCAAAG